MWNKVALALALFAGTAAAAGEPSGQRLDLAITTWLQGAAPRLDEAAALLVFLGNAGTIIPAVAAVGLVWLVFGWKPGGRGAIWLSIGASCVTAVGAVCQNSIASAGPPESLKRHFIRPPDVPLEALHALGVTDAFVVGFAAATLILLLLAEPRRDRALLLLGLTGAGLLVVLLVFQYLAGTPSLQQTVARLDIAPYGYPSGHVARITLLSSLALRRVPWLAAVPVLCMMISLVYLGDHWTSQALGGFWLGGAAGEIGKNVWLWLEADTREPDFGRSA